MTFSFEIPLKDGSSVGFAYDIEFRVLQSWAEEKGYLDLSVHDPLVDLDAIIIEYHDEIIEDFQEEAEEAYREHKFAQKYPDNYYGVSRR